MQNPQRNGKELRLANAGDSSLSSPSFMWKHVYKVSYFSLVLLCDVVTLKKGRFMSQRSSDLLPLLFPFGPFRVRSLQSYSLFCGFGD